MPNLGRIKHRDVEEEAKVLKALGDMAIRRKSLAFSISGEVGKRVAALHLVDKGFSRGSVNRVLRLTPKRVRKALGGPKQHQDFEPYEDDHQLVKLFKRPNHHYVAYDLWAYHMLFKGLTGEVHWWVMRNDLGVPVEIWIIPTHWMRMETDGNGRPVSYAVQSPWGQVQHVPYDQVISFYDHSPLNIYEGQAVTQAISEWIDSYEAQVRARLAMFKNGGAPAFHVALGESYGTDPDEAFLARYYAKWLTRFQGEDNWGKPLLTGPDIEVKSLGVQPDEIPFKEGEDQGRDMTLGAFGTPKGVIGLEPTTDVSAYAPQRQYVRFKINPELKYVGEVVTEKIVKPTPGHDDGIFFFDDHVIDDPEQQLREIAAKWEKGAISPNEIRGMFGDEPWPHGGDDPVLNGAPVPWGTGKDPEPELTDAVNNALGREANDDTGYRNDGFNPDGIDPNADEITLIDKDEGGGKPATPTLRWHKTHDGHLEARGKRRWKIEAVRDRKGKLVSYRLHLDGQAHDESAALGVLKDVAERMEAQEAEPATPTPTTKLAEGAGAAGGFAVGTNPARERAKKVDKASLSQIHDAIRLAESFLAGDYSAVMPLHDLGIEADLRGPYFTVIQQLARSGTNPTGPQFNSVGRYRDWLRSWEAVGGKKSKGAGTPDGIFTVAVDLHGTLADHKKGDDPSPIGPPLPGAKEAMQEFRRRGYRTVINSVFGDVDTIREWLDSHGIPCDYVNESPWGNDTETSGKIDADVYVDDRGLHFNGDWDHAAGKVHERAKRELKSIYREYLDPDSAVRRAIRKAVPAGRRLAEEWMRCERQWGRTEAVKAIVKSVQSLRPELALELLGVAEGIRGIPNTLTDAYQARSAA